MGKIVNFKNVITHYLFEIRFSTLNMLKNTNKLKNNVEKVGEKCTETGFKNLKSIFLKNYNFV